eukprot:NODE_118_length_18907_cov_0.436251.p7 type:complete len:129 gc:universal NODE_118_length_18907_cov_0.436251:5074-4688(-)
MISQNCVLRYQFYFFYQNCLQYMNLICIYSMHLSGANMANALGQFIGYIYEKEAIYFVGTIPLKNGYYHVIIVTYNNNIKLPMRKTRTLWMDNYFKFEVGLPFKSKNCISMLDTSGTLKPKFLEFVNK